MAAKKLKSVIKETGIDRKAFTVKIAPALFDELEALEQRFKECGGKFALDREQIVEDALRAAIRAASGELDRLQR